MPLRLRITGEGLRITGDPGGDARGAPPRSPNEALLATEAGEPIVTETGESITAEPTHGE